VRWNFSCSAYGTCSSFLRFRVYFAVFVFYAGSGILIWEVSRVRAGTVPDKPVRVGCSCERFEANVNDGRKSLVNAHTGRNL
jgi:hypothetical protein